MELAPLLPALLPVPFLLVTCIALLSRNGRNAWLSYLGMFAGLVTLSLAVLVWPSTEVSRTAWEWFTVGPLSVSWTVLLDPLSLTLAALVGGIGAFVFLYSGGYLEKREDLKRYYALLALFAASMVAAVTAGDLVQLLFAWEIIGVTSFLLIGFWHHKESAVRAARKALLTILVGDTALIGGILALAVHYRTTDILTILTLAQPDTITLLAGIGILIGAMSKSAQFPLHDWLPDAMEGPTPVSAFLHSATMVKAGLFLVARMLPLLLLVGLGPWIVLVAIITMLLAATLALVETDVKRVLAYSTMNHLAIILLALGLGATAAALTHIVMHSIVKAMLFFVAGVLIHRYATQDITQMHAQKWSLVAVCALFGAAALAGIPPLAAALSKDAVLEVALATGDTTLVITLAIALVLGAAYLVRWYLLIVTPASTSTSVHTKHHPTDARMLIPLPFLLVGAVCGGFAIPLLHELGIASELHIGWGIALSLLFALTGGLLAWAAVRSKLLDWLSCSVIAHAARVRFLIDELGVWLATGVGRLASAVWSFDDKRVNRTVRGVGNVTVSVAERLRHTVTGRITTYALAVLLGAFGLIFLLRWSP